MLITSRSNPAIKAIRALRSHRRREETGLFFVEGIRIVGEAVDLNADIETLVVAPDLLTSPYALDLVARRGTGVKLLEVSAEVFESLSGKDGPQGIGAVVRQAWGQLEAIDPTSSLCWVALDRAADPGNVGTILRTCDAVGASGVIMLGPSTDPYDPAALRASMGAIFSQCLVRASFDDLTRWKSHHGCLLLGTSDSAQTDYTALTYQPPVILLMGSERTGLTEEMLAACDAVVSIPMAGRSDSLNLAVATGIVLYEAFNQQRGSPRPVGAIP